MLFRGAGVSTSLVEDSDMVVMHQLLVSLTSVSLLPVQSHTGKAVTLFSRFNSELL